MQDRRRPAVSKSVSCWRVPRVYELIERQHTTPDALAEGQCGATVRSLNAFAAQRVVRQKHSQAE
jgi:hypothetical protein